MKIKIENRLMHIFFCKIWKIFLLTFLVLSTDTIYFKTNQNSFPRYISWTIICILAVWCLIKYKLDSQLKSIIIISCILLIQMLIIGDITGGYFFKIALLITGLYVTKIFNWDEFKTLYIKILLVIAVFSLICFVCSYYIVLNNRIPELTNGNYFFKNLFLTNVIKNPSYIGGIKIYRNYGPFWEPGVYQMYLLLAIIFCLFGKTKIQLKETIIFSLTILTTLSTAGYLMLVLVYATFFFRRGYIGIKGLLACGGLFGLMLIFSNAELNHFVFGKFTGGSSQHSTDSRWYSIWANLYIMIIHPLGAGPSKMDLYINEFKDLFHIRSQFTNTNMFLQNFAIYGLSFGFFYMYKLWRFIKSFHENKGISLLLYMIIILELFNEPVIYSLFFSSLIFWNDNNKGMRFKI